ncbi:ATP-dependent RNA helicase DDX24 [Dunckerocampus dactyliophorus]|uniref:ATP-dependent RNA helicase DDX24 n=1 Tax=Dunckerocampus dactyliophorus TaxID=161453 RepID=UPI0024059383|nr:ATP-dependent RNA helicase DDX24 [Dunckerocampus dactyliophorus]
MKTKNTNKKRIHAARVKPLKRSIEVKGQWKAIELDPGLFSEEGLEGLVCFEELRSYRLVDSDKGATNAKEGKKKTKKRKSSEGDEVEKGHVDSKQSEKTSEPAKKKKKTVAVNESTQDETITVQVTQIDADKKEDTSTAPSAITGTKDKRKLKIKSKRKKKNKQNDTEKITEEQTKAGKSSQGEAIKPKKQLKNWTNAALAGSHVKNTDISAWKDLFVPPVVLKALSNLGFTSPTPIQALVLPPAIRDRMDILGAAETGSGKTLAFGIPMIHNILEWKDSSGKPVDNNMNSGSPEPPGANGGSSEELSVQDQEEGSVTEQGEDADEDTVDDEHSDDDQDRGLGCVKVIEDGAVDFDNDSAEAAEKDGASARGRPLLGLVLTPTRELAVQVKHHIDAVARFTDIRTAIVVGGMAQQKQRRMLSHRPEIIIATPGRLWDLIKERHPHLLNLRPLRSLVIDEADRMVERGHFAELESLLEMLNTTHFNPKRQNFVFSATLTMAHSLPTRVLQKKNIQQTDKVTLLMERVGIKSKPKVIDLTRTQATVETLTETQIHCQKEEKDFFLYYFLLQYPGRTMVFANSIDCIKRLNTLLVILDCTPLPLHANMHQKQRLKNLERFAERESCVLLTTDVAARGLDIPDVQHVIHYQVPRTSETYVHRSGRTARATKEGLSLLLIGPDDMMNFKKIYKNLRKDKELPVFPVDSRCMEAIKDRVNLARKIEKIEFYNNRQKHHNSWFRQAAEAMDITLDEDLLLGHGRDEDDDREQQKMVKGMKIHLKHLISQPVFKGATKTKYPTQMGRLCLANLPLVGEESAITRVSAVQKKKNTGASQRKKGKQKKERQ